MKILHLTNKLTFGGKQRFLITLCRELKKRGFDQEVLCFSSLGELKEELESVGVNVRLKKLVRHGYGPKAAISFVSFVKYLRTLDFDVAHIHGYPSLMRVGLALICAGKSFIVQYHSYHPPYKKPLWLLFEKEVLKRALKAIYVSCAVRRSVVKRVWFDPCGIVIYNCPFFSEESLGEKYFDLVWVARFSSQKRPLDFVKIVKYVSRIIRVKAAMLGAGELYGEVKKSIPDFVYMPGFVENVGEYLSKSLIGVSTSEREGMPVSVLEYFKFGLPVVAYKIPAFEEVVSWKVGRLVGLGDKEPFGKVLLRLLSTPVASKRTSVNAVKWSGKFSCEAMGCRYALMYKDLV